MTKCESCVFYQYDENYDDYVCDISLTAFCGYLPGVIVLYDDLWTQIRIKSGLITDQLRQECIHMHTVIFCGFSDVHNKFLPYFIYCLRAVR